jgi:hypothetical protein
MADYKSGREITVTAKLSSATRLVRISIFSRFEAVDIVWMGVACDLGEKSHAQVLSRLRRRSMEALATRCRPRHPNL